MARGLAQPSTDGPQSITIVRRQIIAEIVADPYGNRPMLAVAFDMAGDYLTGRAFNDGEDTDEIEFDYEGRTFTVGYHPTPEK